jgi:hypothetical protein
LPCGSFRKLPAELGGGIAAGASTASVADSDQAAKLVQAMAGFGGGGAADDLNNAPLGAETSQQPQPTTPQHAMRAALVSPPARSSTRVPARERHLWLARKGGSNVRTCGDCKPSAPTAALVGRWPRRPRGAPALQVQTVPTMPIVRTVLDEHRENCQ